MSNTSINSMGVKSTIYVLRAEETLEKIIDDAQIEISPEEKINIINRIKEKINSGSEINKIEEIVKKDEPIDLEIYD